MPVLHEESRICAGFRSLQSQDFAGQAELIVVDGDPEGGTLTALERCGCLESPESHVGWRVQTTLSPAGRARQMNCGAQLATGRHLLFLHADTELPAHGLDRLQRCLGQYHAGAFRLRIDASGWGFRLIDTMANIRSGLSGIPYGDQGIFVRRKVFQELKGYDEVPIMEELMLMRKLRRAGYSLRIEDDAVLVSARRWIQEGLFYCTLRNWALTTLFYLGVPPDRLARLFRYGPKRDAADPIAHEI